MKEKESGNRERVYRAFEGEEFKGIELQKRKIGVEKTKAGAERKGADADRKRKGGKREKR